MLLFLIKKYFLIVPSLTFNISIVHFPAPIIPNIEVIADNNNPRTINAFTVNEVEKMLTATHQHKQKTKNKKQKNRHNIELKMVVDLWNSFNFCLCVFYFCCVLFLVDLI
jgi:hypothetical protein